MSNGLSTCQRLGGGQSVHRLVDRFSDLMDSLAKAAAIRGLHPRHLAGSCDKLYKFLSGWLGGPPLYQEKFGHPRLRARHLPFVIGTKERDAWLLCMEKAPDEIFAEQGISDRLLHEHLLQSLCKIAEHRCNR